MGVITKIYESVFPAPTRENEIKRQISELGDRYIGAKRPTAMPEVTLDAFLMRQRRRMRGAK